MKESYIGKKYNRWTVISDPFYKYNGKYKYLFTKCRCECGCERDIVLIQLKRGHSKSCGCLRIDKVKITGQNNKIHGLYKHPIHWLWRSILGRCYNSNNPSYSRYGGKGIIVCVEWKNNFQSFYNWCIQNGWKEGLEIDRIKNYLGYSPDNCRFTDDIGQANNKDNNIILNIFEENKTVANWARDNRCKVDRNTLYARIFIYKWDYEKALITPLRQKSKLYHIIHAFGEAKNIMDWAKDTRCKVSYETLRQRILYLNWGNEEAIITPARIRK